MFLVEVAQSHRVSEKLIEIVDAGKTYFLVERDRQSGDLSVRLNLSGVLMKNRAGALRTGSHIVVTCTVPIPTFGHFISLNCLAQQGDIVQLSFRVEMLNLFGLSPSQIAGESKYGHASRRLVRRENRSDTRPR